MTDRTIHPRSRSRRRVVLAGLVWTAPSTLVSGALQAQEEARAPRPAIVVGRVVDQASGRPVPEAEVSVQGSTPRLAVANERGQFRIENVAAGTRVLVTRRLGYEERSDTLELPGGALVDVTVRISTRPVELEALVVEVRSAVLAGHGFYERRRQGYGGVFIDREEIVEEQPSTVTDLFRDVPGLRVVYGGIYGARVFVNQRISLRDPQTPGCEPSVWLDGIRSTMGSYDVMRVEEIEGIEIYAGGGAPGKFVDPCGTVVIWTRQRIR